MSLIASVMGRILNLQAEINRVSLLEQNLLVKNKEVVLSNVINGSNQRFRTAKLLQIELHAELDKAHVNIAKWKAYIIKANKQKTELSNHIEKNRSRIAERKVALLSFEINQKKLKKQKLFHKNAYSKHEKQKILSMLLLTWIQFVDKKKQNRKYIIAKMTKRLYLCYNTVFEKWKIFVGHL